MDYLKEFYTILDKIKPGCIHASEEEQKASYEVVYNAIEQINNKLIELDRDDKRFAFLVLTVTEIFNRCDFFYQVHLNWWEKFWTRPGFDFGVELNNNQIFHELLNSAKRSEYFVHPYGFSNEFTAEEAAFIQHSCYLVDFVIQSISIACKAFPEVSFFKIMVSTGKHFEYMYWQVIDGSTEIADYHKYVSDFHQKQHLLFNEFQTVNASSILETDPIPKPFISYKELAIAYHYAGISINKTNAQKLALKIDRDSEPSGGQFFKRYSEFLDIIRPNSKDLTPRVISQGIKAIENAIIYLKNNNNDLLKEKEIHSAVASCETEIARLNLIKENI